ncbi:hypothetical protein GCM10027589_34420 [Actinocorallia lasiicapitis]
MDAGTQKLIKALESQLGYTEKSKWTKFGDWYGENVDDSYDFSHAAWCDMFLTWASDQAGTSARTGEFAYTPAHANWFKKQDAWGTKPEPGAFVFYDWSGGNGIGGIDHVGIVTSVAGGKIRTIEGNVDGIYAKRKVRDQSKVVGYGYPEKVKAEEEGATAEAAAEPGQQTAEAQAQAEGEAARSAEPQASQSAAPEQEARSEAVAEAKPGDGDAKKEDTADEAKPAESKDAKKKEEKKEAKSGKDGHEASARKKTAPEQTATLGTAELAAAAVVPVRQDGSPVELAGAFAAVVFTVLALTIWLTRGFSRGKHREAK